MISAIRRAGGIAATVALAMPLLLLAPSGTASAAETVPSQNDVLHQLGVDQVPADYVILVDTSGSMADGNLYGEVANTLSAFLSGLTSNDYVALYTFDNTPTPRYLGPAGNPGAIIATLPAAPTPNGDTDIGAAIASALGELERPNAAQVGAVVLLTDGEHYPPHGSAYPTTTGPSWTALADRAAALHDHSLAGYALSLRGKTGAALLGTVIQPTTTLSPTTIGALAEYLDRAKTATRIAKAKLLLASDLGQGVSVSWSIPATMDLGSDPVPVTLTLQSHTTHVPLAVHDLQVTGPGGSTVVGRLPAEVDLQAGQTVTFALALSWPQSAGPVPYRRTITASGALTVRGRVDSPWAQPLSPAISLDVPEGLIGSTSQAFAGTDAVGTWGVQFGAAGAGLLIVALWVALAWWRRHQASPGRCLPSIQPRARYGRGSRWTVGVPRFSRPTSGDAVFSPRAG
jgi:hypothetical protein